jgi:squalene cyclase
MLVSPEHHFSGTPFPNRFPISKQQSRSRSRSKTVPEKSVIDFDPEIDQRFSDQNRSAFCILKSISD